MDVDVNGSLALRPQKRRGLKEAVLGYLLCHPEAQDTIDGIAEWWLLERQVSEAVANVEAALGELVRRNFLVATGGNDGRVHYRLNREMERQARAHLGKGRMMKQRSQAPHAAKAGQRSESDGNRSSG